MMEEKKTILADYGLPGSIFDLVAGEDNAQLDKWGYQTHDIFKWMAFITEEVGEMAKAISEYTFRDGTSKEIEREAVQVATLALKVAHMIKGVSYRENRNGTDNGQ